MKVAVIYNSQTGFTKNMRNGYLKQQAQIVLNSKSLKNKILIDMTLLFSEAGRVQAGSVKYRGLNLIWINGQIKP